MGIKGQVLGWIRDWLTNRKQRVCIEGCSSLWNQVTSGVPQGSVLGPLLFIVYVDDMEDGLLNKLLKFADDTKLFGKVRDEGEYRSLQEDLMKLSRWSEKWMMPFNVEKC
jgi:hypothetical protein